MDRTEGRQGLHVSQVPFAGIEASKGMKGKFALPAQGGMIATVHVCHLVITHCR